MNEFYLYCEYLNIDIIKILILKKDNFFLELLCIRKYLKF